ncbi:MULTISPECIES: oxidoreductase [Streptomyces violaceusniger group]|uniref:Oxidoreductase n=1 Tax=Streptomyces antimycoticus TaxID=68175 RepID=A0ABD5J7B9_9ACTN|nr:oxidoreductase [Streptomyces sp. DSM 41602]
MIHHRLFHRSGPGTRHRRPRPRPPRGVTARDPGRLTDVVARHGDRAPALALDVTDKDRVAEAVKKAESAFGLIDVLVNHAGYGYLVALEEGEDEEVRALFDTNVFGVVDVTRAVLPGMRARRAGHVVNISSLGGLAAFGATGYHHATKFAVEGLSESLAAEVAPLGIKVTIVGPPAFRTNWSGPSTRQSAVTLDDYTESAGTRRTSTLATHGHQPGDPARASEAIIGAVEAEEPPLRLLLGKAAYDIVRPGWTPPGPASPPGAMSPSEPTTPWPRPRVCHQRERPAPDAWHGSSLRCRVTRVRPVRGRRSALRSTAPDSPATAGRCPLLAAGRPL